MQTIPVQNFPFCGMGDGRDIELLLGATGEKLGFGGGKISFLISSILQCGFGNCF